MQTEEITRNIYGVQLAAGQIHDCDWRETCSLKEWGSFVRIVNRMDMRKKIVEKGYVLAVWKDISILNVPREEGIICVVVLHMYIKTVQKGNIKKNKEGVTKRKWWYKL